MDFDSAAKAATEGIGVVAAAKKLFTFKHGDIPVCHTRVMRGGMGLPWNRQIALHPLKNGKLEITVLP